MHGAFQPLYFHRRVSEIANPTILIETVTSEQKKDLGFSRSWIAKAKAKENLSGFNFFRKCGLLLWLVRAQHDHYKIANPKQNLVSLFAVHYESQSE